VVRGLFAEWPMVDRPNLIKDAVAPAVLQKMGGNSADWT
jgi:hypothetical protein